MTHQDLAEAFAFYGIESREYLDRLTTVLDEINASEEKQRGFARGCARVYTRDSEVLSHIWATDKDEEFFGRKMPAFTSDLLIFEGYHTHREAMARLSMDEEQIRIQKALIAQRADYFLRDGKPVPLYPAIFSTQFCIGKILQIGRLQFEFENIDGKQPVNAVSVHIPAEGRLDRALVDDAFARATPILKEKFGVDTLVYHCHSWLLGPELGDCLPEGSNMAYFRSLFKCETKDPCNGDVLNYLYHKEEPCDYHTLQEDTSLQRSVKAALLAGVVFHSGAGEKI